MRGDDPGLGIPRPRIFFEVAGYDASTVDFDQLQPPLELGAVEFVSAQGFLERSREAAREAF